MNVSDVKNSTSQVIGQYEKNSGTNKTDAVQGVPKKPAVKPAGPSGSPDVKVDFSAQSKDFVQIKNAVAQLPEVREEKVQALKAQIEKGEYNVDSAKIAEKMVKESLLDIFA
jgi:negative regulator of flagellin synthesis FlgM